MFKKFSMTATAILLLLAGCEIALANPQAVAYPQVIAATRHDLSPPLTSAHSNLPPVLRAVVQGRHPSRERLRELRQKLIASGLLKPVSKQSAAPFRADSPALNPPRAAHDTVLQRGIENAQTGGFTTPLLNFDGLGFADEAALGFPLAYTPPDDSTAVGMKYVVEVANLMYAVYDKSTGARVMGPVALGDLWAGFGGNCGRPFASFRHPAVLFDQWAQRWVISLPVYFSSTYCVAISATSDPTGAYYRYEYDNLPPRFRPIGSNKLGLWPNAYLATMDANSFSGALQDENFVALDRTAMLQGQPTSLLLWSLPQTAGVYGDLPVSADGMTPPPAGEPALFANYTSPNLFGINSPYAISLWKLTLDWSNPASSLLNGPFQIDVPAFNDMLCGNQKDCIAQPVPGEKLDAVSDRLMFPLAYRNFGDHEALVVNQTVTANVDGSPPAGIRWYELDTSAPGANDWSLAQSGTFDPADGNSRWIGSLAMDTSGDMALGYSLASANTNPSVVYTGRKAGDPKGQMTQPETTLVAGGGVQQQTFDWGAFSSMAVDPADGCTFWYTNEYYPATGGYRWNTRIGAFRFSSCTPITLGTLKGTVTNAATSQTIAGAEIVLNPNFITTHSDDAGNYRYSLAAGDYTAIAFDFGYVPAVARVSVTEGNVTELDLSLEPAPTATLSGHVTDAGHGYGLYAEVKIDAQGVGQVADVWTNPSTGAYSAALPKGFDYTLNVSAYADGFQPAAPVQVTLNGDTNQDFALTVGATCSAPGYSVSSGFSEDFNGTFPPAGWSLSNGIAGSPVVWNTNTYWGDPNWTGGSGTAADMNSSAATTRFGYTGNFDDSLISPPIPVSAISADPVLQFKLNYAHFDFRDQVFLYIFPSGGRVWTEVQHWNSTAGTPFGLPGQVERIDLRPYIPAGTKTVQLLWRYLFFGTGDVWYAQVDDVVIGACKPVDGGLISGRVTDANTGAGVLDASLSDDRGGTAKIINNPADPGLAAGTYVLFSSAGKHDVAASAAGYSPGSAEVTVQASATVTQDFSLGAGKLAPVPGTVDIHVPVNGTLAQALTIDNSGNAAAHYRVTMLNAPASADHAQFMGPFAAAPVYKNGVEFTAPSAVAPTSGRQASLPPVPASSPRHAGDVVATFDSGINLFGLGVDRDARNLWLGNPAQVNLGGQGDDKDYGYFFSGSRTGDTIDVANPDVIFMADMAYDDVTGMLWQISVDQPPTPGALIDYSHIYELDPKTLAPTGKRILVPSAQSERGLAFDPVSGTWYAGDFNSEAIYHFDAAGTLLDSTFVGLPIQALAYNSATGHLFVLTSGGNHAVYVLDAKHGYAPVTTFDIPGFNPQNAGAGFGYDCDGHLWISDYVDRVVFEVVSGETGWCAIKHIPWLTVSPAAGTLAAGASTTVTLDFDGTGQTPFTSSQAQLKLSGTTPYPVRTIPLVVHWDPQPVSLAIAGSGAPDPVKKGSPVAYGLTVTNKNAAGQGSATETRLTYALPAGASYVSGGGDGVVCTTQPAGSSAAPAAGSAPASGSVMCSLGTLAPDAAKAVTLVVTPGLAGTLASTFTVSAREPESDPSTTSITLTGTVIGVADLSTSTQNLSLSVNKSGTLNFTVANAGPDPATAVTFTLTSASGVMTSATVSQGSCEAAGGTGFNCNLGDVAPGASVAVVVGVRGAAVGSMIVTGQASTTATDSNGQNGAAQATITVTPSQSGGGGGFALFALIALLGLVSASLAARRLATVSAKRDSRLGRSGENMIKRGKTLLSVVAMTALVTLAGVGLAALASPAQAKAPEQAQTGLHAGLTSSGVAMAQRDLAPGAFVPMSLQSVPALLKQATLLGAHDPASSIRLTVSLKLRNVSGLKQFLQELRDPRSPVYRQFLTPAEFTAAYGPTASQVAAVEKYLQGYGIKVNDVSPNRLLIHAQGTTVAFENALGVRINDYRMNSRSFFSTAERPKLPVAIAGFVQNVIGLNNAAQARPMSYFKPFATNGSGAKARSAAQASAASPAPPPQSSAYYNPAQIRTAYDWPSITDSDNGSGVTIAILTALSSNIQASDYEGFWNAFGLPDHTVNIIKVDGDNNSDAGMGETLLDMEWSGALSPGATLDVYVGVDPSFGTLLDLYNRLVTDNKAQVMTTSWGAPESSWGTLAQTADNIFAEAAAQGISMFAASGDHGSGDGTGFANMADFPSADPYVTAANGTELFADAAGNYGSEIAWSDTGGAISQVFSQPAWQTGPEVPQNGWRNNSDLAMNAGPARPYIMLFNGQWFNVWGTSAVAPELAGLFAIGIWQNGGRSLGQSNELIYADVNANSSNYASDFHDVTTGSNGAYNAGTNWDHPTGWGTPRATSLLGHLGVQGPVGTLQGTVSDSAAGQTIANAKVVVTPNNISRITQSDGSYSILLAPGTYTVTVTDYGYTVGSASVTITDGQTTTQDFSLSTVPDAVVSGTVKDGANHGYGLYAEIKVTSPGFGQVADLWTDPSDGSYSVSLPEGFDYAFQVAAAFNGYDPGSWTVSDLGADQTHDFALALAAACTAPGYKFVQGFGEDFNVSFPFPPSGWSDTSISVVRWASAGPGFGFNKLPNWTGGSGNAAGANASGGLIQNNPFDTRLITPPIPVTSLPPSPSVSFLLNYQHTPNDSLDVDISGDGGTTWTTMAHIVTSHGTFHGAPGVPYTVNMAGFIPPGATSIQVRWRYVNPVNFIGNYAEIDDVSIGACETLSGGLVFGQVTDANGGDGVIGATVSAAQGNRVATIANPADPNFPTGGYLLFAAAGAQTLTVSDYNYADAKASFNLVANTVTTKNFSLKAGQLTPDPTAVIVEAVVNETANKALTITNSGEAPAQFEVREINMPAPPAAVRSLRITGTASNLAGTKHERNPAALAATSVIAGSGAGTPLAEPTASPAAQTAGAVIATFRPGMPIYGLGVDHDALDLWLGSPVNNGGDDQDHRFLFSGTNTGAAIGVAFPGALYMADMAYDDNTGKLWQLSVSKDGLSSCVYELDPVTLQATGKKLCPSFPLSQRGLAYDPVGNTWISGDFVTQALYQFNDQGQILGSKTIDQSIQGLAYNPGTGHLFVLTSGGDHAVYVYDATKGFLTPPTHFDIPGFNPQNAGAGLGYDCAGHLWITDMVDNEVFEVASGEQGWCAIKHIPWLSVSPAAGSVANGDSASVTLTFNGNGEKAFTTSQAQLKLSGTTPYPVRTIPVTVHWVAQPVHLVLTGSAAPSPVQKGSGLVYSLAVENAEEADHGAATETELTYDLPAGASFVSAGGDGVTCTAVAAGTTSAPAATSVSGAVNCDLGALAQGVSKTVAIAVSANAAGTLTSVFSVKAREPDSDSSTNTLTLETQVLGTADIGVSAPTSVTLKKGKTGTIQFAVANAGPDPATDVELKLSAVGSNVDLQSAASDAGSCTASANNTIECDLGELAANGTATVEVTSLGAQLGTATVTGQVTTSANDPNSANGLAQSAVTVVANSGGGGGGGFGWLALAALLGLAFATTWVGQRRG